MAKTLIFLTTFNVDENVIAEYRKIKNTPNVDGILAIDNTNPKIEFESRVETKNLFGTDVKCFFFDSNLHDEMQLPYLTSDGIAKFSDVMWHNCDYRFYYVRKFFPQYDYYWQIEYDVFCNAETYAGFLEKFEDNHADLLVQAFGKSGKGDKGFLKNLDWLYSDDDKLYSGVFAVVRLSARAIDFLYRKRLEQVEIFKNSTEQFKQWAFCEVFVPTALVNGGFTCKNLGEERVKFLPYIYLNDERIFLKPDNHLYHPVKSVIAEISKLQKQYADLFYCFRKSFLSQLAEKLTAGKDLPVHFGENFTSMTIDLAANRGGVEGSLRCEAWFLTHKLHGVADKLYAAVVFEGEYLKYFKILESYIDVTKMASVQILGNDTCRMLAYHTETFDNVQQVAHVLEIFIGITHTVLQEKIYENN